MFSRSQKEKNTGEGPSAPSSKNLDAFYRTSTGKYLSNEIENCLTSSWPREELKDYHMLCVGFPPPGIMENSLQGESFALFSPSFLGSKKIVRKGQNMSAVGDETHLPFREGSYDRVLVFHALEYTEDETSLIEGVWKVLSPGGRIFLMVPNKKGAWKKSGLPYPEMAKSFLFREVRSFLKKNGFTLVSNYGAWFGLPVDFFGTVLFSGLLKRLSGGGSVGFPGFLIFEAEKKIISPICKPTRAFKKVPANPAISGIIPE
jgi:hypothetical protein